MHPVALCSAGGVNQSVVAPALKNFKFQAPDYKCFRRRTTLSQVEG